MTYASENGSSETAALHQRHGEQKGRAVWHGNKQHWQPWKPKCFSCGQKGHFQRDCQRKQEPPNSAKPMLAKHNAKPAEVISIVDSTDSEDGVFAVSSTSASVKEEWLIDSRATSHMTHSKEILYGYRQFETHEQVSLGDGRTVNAPGTGDITVKMNLKVSEHKRCAMRNVLYVPNLTCNLFSVRAAVSKGNVVRFGNDKCWIRDIKRGN